MSSPFEENDGSYHVLLNDEEQYSLWPASLGVPAGWRIALNEANRQDCLAFIEENWSDMRPRSLRSAMKSTTGTCSAVES
ncbi:MbtH family protein [Streptomyces sp. NPDC003720]|uniref:MbtH family protein n=1 Tax=Streptomyces sp. NPDC003720 TaxID=3364684 RepID=UPI0036B5C1A9